MSLAGIQKTSLLAGIAGAALCVAGYFVNRPLFLAGYLNAYGFWLAIAIGSLGMLLLHRLTGGYWGEVMGPMLRAAVQTLPVLAFVLLPVLIFAGDVYPWMAKEVSHHIAAKKAWLNFPFFALRAALYFAVWVYFGRMVGRVKAAPGTATGKAGLGVLLLCLTISFAAFDWFMSLEPEWFSSIYGALFIIGSVMACIATSVIFLNVLKVEVPADRWHDLGKLLLMSVMVWAYFNFSQYLIIWSAKIPEEMVWYHHRSGGGLKYLGLGLVVFHFGVPFMILLSRGLKRRGDSLLWIALGLLVMRFFDFLWWTQPAVSPNHFVFPIWSLAAMLGIGGIWLHFFSKALAGQVAAEGRHS